MTTLTKLLIMRHELAAAMDADLETGSHHWNNKASEEFAKKHPRTMKWMNDFTNMVDEEVDSLEKQTS